MSAAQGADEDGQLEIRPIRPDDETMWRAFMRDMSWVTRYKRGARRLEQLSDAEVKRAVQPNPGTEIAYVAVATRGGEAYMAGVARGTYVTPDDCEFMLVVGDGWQGRGIGRRLMQALMDETQSAGRRRVVGRVLATNGNMLDFVRGLGFRVEDEPGDATVRRVVRELPVRRGPD